jgi:hypothetical protein
MSATLSPAAEASVRVLNVGVPAVEVIVTVSVPFVVNVIPEPAARLSVSVTASAATEVCPDTAIVLKAFWLTSPPPPPASPVIVTESVAASVVSVMFEPATSVRVSL